MKQHRLMTRVVGVALGLAVAIATLSLASAQQEPPHRFYGHGATAGDTIGVHMDDDDLTLIASATVDENGSWYIDVDRDEAEDVVFSINGAVADSEVTSQGAGQDAVTLTAMAMEDDSMMDEGEDGEMSEDETMMEEDGEMSDDDSMMDEDSMDDGHMDDSMADNGYPATGSGGMAADGGVSAGLVGLLIALGAAAIAGIGVRRVRNRA